MVNSKFVIRQLPIEAINVPDGHRAINPDAIPGLVDSIRRIGLRTPIAVRMLSEAPVRADLVAGGHRIEAFKFLGLKEIECLILETDLEARLWRRSENLHRSELSQQERAEEIVSWLADASELIPGQLDQDTGGRGQRGGLSEVARLAGIERTEARRAKVIAGISHEAKGAATALGLADNQTALLEIARAESAEAQVQKAEELAKQKKKKSANPEQEFKTLKRVWDRSRASVRARFVAEVVKLDRPPAPRKSAVKNKIIS